MTITIDQHRDWIAKAGEVAAVLAEDALARDLAGAEPVAEAQLLRDSGLPALLYGTAPGVHSLYLTPRT